MSHYAQIVEPLPLMERAHVLPIGTQVKNIELRDGHYTFDGLLPTHGGWERYATTEDLPAFTDRGRAHRERSVAATLKPGRPPGGGTTQERAIAFRPTTEQREWLQARAKKKRTTMSKLVRDALIALGMPS